MVRSAVPQRESGAALLLFVVLLASMVTIFMGSYVASLGGMTVAANRQRDKAYVESAAKQLRSWYTTHPVAMDGQSSPSVKGCRKRTTLCLFQAAGVTEKHGVKLQIGSRQQSSDGYDYRTLMIWIPKPDVRGQKRNQYAASRAMVSTVVSGRSIEQSLWVHANHVLETLASSWTQAYSAWLSTNGNANADWFVPSGCGPNGVNGQMDCASSWTDIGKSGLDRAAGLALPASNPWGLPYQICNTSACGGNQSNVPYSALIRTRTPWGGSLEQAVVEPLTTN